MEETTYVTAGQSGHQPKLLSRSVSRGLREGTDLLDSDQ